PEFGAPHSPNPHKWFSVPIFWSTPSKDESECPIHCKIFGARCNVVLPIFQWEPSYMPENHYPTPKDTIKKQQSFFLSPHLLATIDSFVPHFQRLSEFL